MTTRIEIDRGALNRVYEGLANGVHQVSLEAAAIASAHHPKIPHRVVTTLNGKHIAGEGKMPAEAGSAAGQIHSVIEFDAPAHWIELGTPAHDIESKAGKAMPIGDGKFARKVHNPGIHPQPFINPAFAAATARSDSLIAAGVAERIGA